MGNIFCPQNRYLSDAYYYDKSSWFIIISQDIDCINDTNIDTVFGMYSFYIYTRGMDIENIKNNLDKIKTDTSITNPDDIKIMNIIRKFSNDIVRCLCAYIEYENNQDITDQINRYLFTYDNKPIIEIRNTCAKNVQQELKTNPYRSIGKLNVDGKPEHYGRLYPLEFSECEKC
jgi:hypothetical protein